MVSAESLIETGTRLQDVTLRPRGYGTDLKTRLAVWVPVVGVLAWTYGGTLTGASWPVWLLPDFAQRLLVPLLAAGLLWSRRDLLEVVSGEGSWWGLPLLLLGALLEAAAVWSCEPTFHLLSALPCLAGVVLVVWGWQALWWAGPSIGFLVFLCPLPEALNSLLSVTLQRLVTNISACVLQVTGVPCFAAGNTLVLRDSVLGLTDAERGVQLLAAGLVACTGVTLLVTHGMGERMVLLLSALPLVLAANVARMTLLALRVAGTPHSLADARFHAVINWGTVALAVLALLAELALLSWLSGLSESAPVPESRP